MSNTSRFARASVAVLLASTATVLLGGCSWFSFCARLINPSISGVARGAYQARPSGIGFTSFSGILISPENFLEREHGRMVKPIPDCTAISMLSKLV